MTRGSGFARIVRLPQRQPLQSCLHDEGSAPAYFEDRWLARARPEVTH